MRKTALTIVCAVAPVMGTSLAAPIPFDMLEWQRDFGRQVVDDAVQIARGSTNEALDISTELLSAAPVPGLVQMSKSADMVVVGCRGRGAFARTLLGSVSTGLVHHAHCPVAVIHDEAQSASVGSQLPVLVGVDTSPTSEVALALGFDEASGRGVELVALHAWWGSGAFEFSLDWDALQPKVEESVADQLATWQERYSDVTIRRVVVRDQPARELVDRSQSAQLIVVGSHGHGRIGSALLGSVSTAVVQAARVPVIVARS
jgi:nucleotide-binding universal stress UspA family protein